MIENATSLRSILVTGASTGIGEACVLELDRRGHRVFAGVRSEKDAQRLRGQGSQRLIPVLLDVTSAEQITAAAAKVREIVGDRGLDGLVNNAGIGLGGPLEVIPLEKLRLQFEVNVVGQIAVTQAMIPLLRMARGRIVNVGSLNGRISAPYIGPYAASKHAMEALTDAMRLELRHWGIAVSIIEPANVKTPIWGKVHDFTDHLIGEVTPEQLALYQRDVEAMRHAVTRLAETGMPVQRVVHAVLRALFARRPRTRYPVGAGIGILLNAVKFVPDRVRDWFILREMGLGR